MARENRGIRRKTRYIGQSTYIQSNCFIFDPTPRFIPVLFEIVQEALLLPPRVKMLLHRWRYRNRRIGEETQRASAVLRGRESVLEEVD